MSQNEVLDRRTMAVDSHGKTRLPIEFQRQIAGESPDRLQFDLVEVEESGDVYVRVTGFSLD